jgi:hypothetical protein
MLEQSYAIFRAGDTVFGVVLLFYWRFGIVMLYDDEFDGIAKGSNTGNTGASGFTPLLSAAPDAAAHLR